MLRAQLKRERRMQQALEDRIRLRWFREIWKHRKEIIPRLRDPELYEELRREYERLKAALDDPRAFQKPTLRRFLRSVNRRIQSI